MTVDSPDFEAHVRLLAIELAIRQIAQKTWQGRSLAVGVPSEDMPTGLDEEQQAELRSRAKTRARRLIGD